MNTNALIDILLRVRELVALPDNDFSWSSWGDAENAFAEIDGIIAQLHRGEAPDRLTMKVLFAPTGPMQELSLSSGWGNRFLQLASEFDDAIGDAEL
ncbi:MAG: hypothetical protein R3C27_07900 [Hyphomonadaceae bacterium]